MADPSEGGVVVRDSRAPEGPVLRFTPDEWHAFLLGVKDGDFDNFGCRSVRNRHWTQVSDACRETWG